MWSGDIVIDVFKNIDLRFKKIDSFKFLIWETLAGLKNFINKKDADRLFL